MIIETLAALTIAMILTSNCMKVFKQGASKAAKLYNSNSEFLAATKGVMVNFDDLPPSVKQKFQSGALVYKVDIKDLSTEEFAALKSRSSSCMTNISGDLVGQGTDGDLIYYSL